MIDGQKYEAKEVNVYNSDELKLNWKSFGFGILITFNAVSLVMVCILSLKIGFLEESMRESMREIIRLINGE